VTTQAPHLIDTRSPETEDDLSNVYGAYRVEVERLASHRAVMQMAAEDEESLTDAGGPKLGGTIEAISDQLKHLDEPDRMTLGKLLMSGFNASTDVPTQILGGLLDDLPEDLGKSLDDFVNKPLTKLTFKTFGFSDEETDKFIEDALALKDRAPDIDIKEPKTPTGGVARGISKFMGAFLPVLSQVRQAQMFAKLGSFGRPAGEALAAGIAAGTVMDPLESALDFFVDENPILRNPVEDFLSSDLGNESRMAARLRNAMVDAGLGSVADGVMAGLGGLRRMRMARQEAKAGDEAAGPAGAGAADELFEVTDEMIGLGLSPGATVLRGGPGGRRLALRPRAEERLASAEREVERMFPPGTLDDDLRQARAELESSAFEINFDRIRTSEDVESMMQDAVDLMTERIRGARRGVITNRETEIMADQLGVTMRELLDRRPGQTLNAAESLAYRRIHVAAGEKLEEMARAAASPNAGRIDLYRLRRALAIYTSVSEQVLGARAEAGRALQAWNISAESVGRAQQIQALIDATGGDAVNQALALKIVQLSDAGALPGQLATAARKGVVARTMAAIKESFVLGLLWMPKTHVVNIASPYIVGAMQVAERALAGQISKALGREVGEGVHPLEYLAYAYGMKTGITDMFTIGAMRMRQANGVRAKLTAPIEGIGELREQMGIPRTSKLEEGVTQGAITSEVLGLGFDDATRQANGLGRLVDAYGRITRLPGAALGFEDDMGKIVGFSAEVSARAHREALSQGGTRAEIEATWARLMADPPRDIRLAGIDNSTYITFTNQAGDIASALGMLRDGVPILGPMIFPFVRTPANILNYSFQRTPLGIFSSKFWADVEAGGAVADIALARLSLGAATCAMFLDYAMAGRITGSGMIDPGQRGALLRQNIQPDSIQIGENWYRFNRMDALGMQGSFSSTFADVMDRMDVDEQNMPEVQEILAAAAIATATSAMSKTWLFGMSNMVMAMKYGESFGEDYVSKSIASFTPFSSALRTTAEMTRDTLPDANSAWEHVLAMIPILEAKLPRKMNLWGDVIRVRGPHGVVYDFLSPLAARRQLDSPIDREIFANRMDIRRIRKRTSFPDPVTGQTATVNLRDFPRVYETLVWLSGQGAKIGGKGARDSLNEMVQGKGPMGQTYIRRSGGEEGVKRSMVQNQIERYRRLSKQIIMKPEMARAMGLPKEVIEKLESPEFQEFREHVGERGHEALQLQFPTAPTPAPEEASVRIGEG
jgi:hypothetical protein